MAVSGGSLPGLIWFYFPCRGRRHGCFVIPTILFIGAIIFCHVFNTLPISSLLEEVKQEDCLGQSTCSCQADRRGFGQKVVSYSLYGDYATDQDSYDRYLLPMKNVAEVIHQSYPGWAIRIYVNSTARQDPSFRIAEEFFLPYTHVDVCNVTRVLESLAINLDVFPMTWRFLPLLDRTVDLMLSRDTDSRVIGREVEAVDDWIQRSNSTFHVMRDHSHHCVQILGGSVYITGTWGAKVYQRRQDIVQYATNLFNDPQASEAQVEGGLDQLLLDSHIWLPLAEDDHVAHDSYCCRWFPSTRPFPSRRQGSDFVGMVQNEQTTSLVPCPSECRPAAHPDWIHC